MAVIKATLNTLTNDVEDEIYWKKHVEAQVGSGLSKAAYCRLNQVCYDRFIYWSQKYSTVRAPLVAVKLKSSFSVTESSTLCTLLFNNGHVLKIHDSSALSFILEKLQ